ncbi:methyltransferase domain-containing protein [Cytobacillus spongiae]|uniref:methyltransferase domain-containing protein n=1 Tax=Cytobacillus spongiae TaxID=2901381 RepID=UPI001F40CDA5|nr:methyltransferase domain-containing protein [Cytobacillus spongiae]UII55500.1 methyltransferase domain-containing protein [Cytobacillus spongiae]
MNDGQSWEDYYHNNLNPWTEADETLVEAVEGIRTGKALDLGAGEGGNSYWLAAKGWKVTSIDQAPSAVATIKRIADNQELSIQAYVEDVFRYQSEERYDLIIMSYLHFSTDKRIELFDKYKELLNTGGLFIYLGFSKDEATLPKWASPDEFPSSQVVANQLLSKGFQILDHADCLKTIPIGHEQGTFEGITTKVIAKRGVGLYE